MPKHRGLSQTEPVFEFTSESSSSLPMREVWVHRFKCKNGWLDSVKARCSCDGSSGVRGVTCHESYAGTAPIDDVRRMESRAVNLGWCTDCGMHMPQRHEPDLTR